MYSHVVSHSVHIEEYPCEQLNAEETKNGSLVPRPFFEGKREKGLRVHIACTCMRQVTRLTKWLLLAVITVKL